jgi:hypothetical protein
MKLEFLTGVSSMAGSFAKGQVVEVENNLAAQWVRANFARTVGLPPPVVRVEAASTPVVPPVEEPVVLIQPSPASRRGAGRRK